MQLEEWAPSVDKRARLNRDGYDRFSLLVNSGEP